MHIKKENPLFDFDQKRFKVHLQEEERSIVRVKKRGRPIKPNMKRFVIKMDETLKNNLFQYAQRQGVPMSSVISIAVRRLIANSNDHI